MKPVIYGFVKPSITNDNFVFGSALSLGQEILQHDGQWDDYLPAYEIQDDKFETAACTIYGTENCIEILSKKLYDQEFNFSERYPYILAPIRPPGGDPHKVAECIRHFGLVEQWDLPMTDTFEEFVLPDPMSDYLLKKGKRWLEKNDFGHEWLFTSNPSQETRTALFMQALRYSPLGVSVSAWYEDGGVYKDLNLPNNHWCSLYGWNAKGWKLFDSYDHSLKILSFDHHVEYAKRYSLKPRLQKEFWWQLLIRRISEICHN